MNTPINLKTVIVMDPDQCPFHSYLYGCVLKDYSRHDDSINELHDNCPLQDAAILVARG